MKVCSIDSCETVCKSGQWCEKHRSRFRAHGDPNIVLKDHTPARERWKKLYVVDPTTGCWNWTGQKSRGYGVISDGVGKQHTAHRLVWQQTGRTLIEGLELDHLCRNKGCVNPEHLEQVTHEVNVQRGEAGIKNSAKTECKYGHEFTPENTSYNKRGQRNCRACTRRLVREATRRYRARRKSASE